MLHLFRRHCRSLARTLAVLLALGWVTLGLQPCMAAQPAKPTVAPMAHHHHHGMAMEQQAQPRSPCAPGSDCPVFKAVDNQAASKAAEAYDVPAPAVAVLPASWPQPPTVVHAPDFPRVARATLPAPPILEFRVLLI